MAKIPDSQPGYPGSIPGLGIKISLHCHLTEITVISGQILILSDTISLFAKWTQYLAHKIAMKFKLYYLLKGLSSVSAEYQPLNKSIPSLFPASPQSPHHTIPSQAYIVQNKGTLIQFHLFSDVHVGRKYSFSMEARITAKWWQHAVGNNSSS